MSQQPIEHRRRLIEPEHQQISIRRQCQLVALPRSSYYYQPEPIDPEELQLLHQIDRIYTERPFFGSRRIVERLRSDGYEVNRKRAQRLMRQLGLAGIAPKPGTSDAAPQHRIYPYLLRNVAIVHRNQVWSSDITYIPLSRSFCYLTAVIDWYSRYVLSWELSRTLHTDFCLSALDRALRQGTPRVFNSDQGSQFTAGQFIERLNQAEIAISMDGRGCYHDNIFIERLWRTVKYEEIYLHEYADLWDLHNHLDRYFCFYNTERPHQSLGYLTPYQVYHDTSAIHLI